jgi:hypothetical protein
MGFMSAPLSCFLLPPRQRWAAVSDGRRRLRPLDRKLGAFDLAPGLYILELNVLDKARQVTTSWEEKFLHGNPASKK